jgi:hypothetical protein
VAVDDLWRKFVRKEPERQQLVLVDKQIEVRCKVEGNNKGLRFGIAEDFGKRGNRGELIGRKTVEVGSKGDWKE